MKPTLKPGCLAMIVKSMAGNKGKIVTCLKFIPSYQFIASNPCPAWEMAQWLPTKEGGYNNVVRASWLIPINDPDLEIETNQDIQLKEKV